MQYAFVFLLWEGTVSSCLLNLFSSDCRRLRRKNRRGFKSERHILLRAHPPFPPFLWKDPSLLNCLLVRAVPWRTGPEFAFVLNTNSVSFLCSDSHIDEDFSLQGCYAVSTVGGTYRHHQCQDSKFLYCFILNWRCRHYSSPKLLTVDMMLHSRRPESSNPNKLGSIE